MPERIFGPKRGEVTGEWRQLHNEELNDLYSSPNTVRVIKSRRMRWTGHAAPMGRAQVYKGFWQRNLGERDQWEDPRVDGRIILRWIDVAQNRNRWRALVNAVMNLGFPQGIY